MTRRSLQAWLAVSLLSGGLLLSATTGTGTTGQEASPAPLTSLDAPVFLVEVRPDRLHLQGTTASAVHESGLLRLAADQFDSLPLETDFRPGVVVGSYWESASERLLYALATTESARAVLREDSVEVRGATSDADSFAARMQFFREELPANTTVVADVVAIESRASDETLCRHAFAKLHVQPISFTQSSAQLRSSSYATLDRMADFANDCRQLQIAVTGHTDASGDEAWNRRLSLQRAQAVADYLVASGIDARRLLVQGVGSAVPIADNATVAGRNRNRRIEFALP